MRQSAAAATAAAPAPAAAAAEYSEKQHNFLFQRTYFQELSNHFLCE